MSAASDWKVTILRRYAGEYLPAGDSPAPLRKSSEDIAFDLSGMGDFHPDEISAFLAVSGYEIAFDDGKPVWLLRNASPANALPES
jgi:hypothetical protein